MESIETAGTLESTESYKERQTEKLIKFANPNKLWIDIARLSVIYLDKGDRYTKAYWNKNINKKPTCPITDNIDEQIVE